MGIPWASALSAYNKSSPNMLLYWGLLQMAVHRGMEKFDFGRCTPGEGTHRFKEQWGATPSPLFWYGENLVDESSLRVPHSSGRKILEKTWSRLPLFATDMLGPWVRKYISY
jgi:hypothetical protein